MNIAYCCTCVNWAGFVYYIIALKKDLLSGLTSSKREATCVCVRQQGSIKHVLQQCVCVSNYKRPNPDYLVWERGMERERKVDSAGVGTPSTKKLR